MIEVRACRCLWCECLLQIPCSSCEQPATGKWIQKAVLHDILYSAQRVTTVFSTLCSSLLLFIQLEAFYSIFTTEQQDHVKSVEYLRNNFRPLQNLDNRKIFKSAVKDAWQRDLTEIMRSPHSTEASRGEPPFSTFYILHLSAIRLPVRVSLQRDCYNPL